MSCWRRNPISGRSTLSRSNSDLQERVIGRDRAPAGARHEVGAVDLRKFSSRQILVWARMRHRFVACRAGTCRPAAGRPCRRGTLICRCPQALRARWRVSGRAVLVAVESGVRTGEGCVALTACRLWRRAPQPDYVCTPRSTAMSGVGSRDLASTKQVGERDESRA